jgi:ubiquinone/menaquinone biosynthesis C-methylase UbiE
MSGKYLDVFYSKTAEQKSDYPFRLAEYLVNRFHILPGQTLLDLGCGRGDFLLSFQKLGLKCIGVDNEITPELKSLIDIKKIDLSSQPLPFTDNSVDVVFQKSFIEHFHSPKNLMEESYRVLRPNGKIIILTPDWSSQKEVFYDDFTHCRPYTTSAVQKILQSYGYKNITIEKFYQLPLVWRYPSLKFLLKPLGFILPTTLARRLSQITGIKSFRWSVELMVLGTGIK